MSTAASAFLDDSHISRVRSEVKRNRRKWGLPCGNRSGLKMAVQQSTSTTTGGIDGLIQSRSRRELGTLISDTVSTPSLPIFQP